MTYLRGATNPKTTRRIYLLVLTVCGVGGIFLQWQWMGRKTKIHMAPVYRFSKIIGDQTQRVYCEDCGGSGVLRSPHDASAVTPCDVCFGLGTHRIRRLEYSDVMCRTCRGMGRISGEQQGTSSECTTCDGRGLVALDKKGFTIYATSVICAHCDGVGSVRVMEEGKLPRLELCPVCFGLGDHWVRKMDNYDKLCAGCEGMGRRATGPESLDAVECEHCRGRGLVMGGDAPVPVENVEQNGRVTEVEIEY